MGVFTRFKDIVSSNLNAMLDHAEDPEKMVRLMIREMEETLVELKANCAGSMAEAKKIRRQLDEVDKRATSWSSRAELAVDKGRDDLAREALLEKRRHDERSEAIRRELEGVDALTAQAQEDIDQLEQKLAAAKEKQRLLIQRHHRARDHKRSRDDLRKAESADVIRRFEYFEQNIERMEAEAELAGPRQVSLEEEFSRLENDHDLEAELAALKQSRSQDKEPAAKDAAKKDSAAK